MATDVKTPKPDFVFRYLGQFKWKLDYINPIFVEDTNSSETRTIQPMKKISIDFVSLRDQHYTITLKSDNETHVFYSKREDLIQDSLLFIHPSKPLTSPVKFSEKSLQCRQDDHQYCGFENFRPVELVTIMNELDLDNSLECAKLRKINMCR